MIYNDNDMIHIAKAHFDNDNLTLSLPIAKVDQEKRIVSGFATLDNIDKQNDIILPAASKKAFEGFRGNIRLMHQPIPAGKMVSFREEQFTDTRTGKRYNGIFVDAYISKGAQDVWEMVLDGTLTGFSIGGKILDWDMSADGDSDKGVRVVKDYELVELSLVDNPANQFANIFSIQKNDNIVELDGMMKNTEINNIFYCKYDNKAFSSTNETMACLFCESNTEQIGWVESQSKQEIGDAIVSTVRKYLNAGEPTQEKETVTIKYKTYAGAAGIDDYVAFNNDGEIIKGRVESMDDSSLWIRVYERRSDGLFSPIRYSMRIDAQKAYRIGIKDSLERMSDNITNNITLKGGIDMAENDSLEKSADVVEDAVEFEVVESLAEPVVDEASADVEKADTAVVFVEPETSSDDAVDAVENFVDEEVVEKSDEFSVSDEIKAMREEIVKSLGNQDASFEKVYNVVNELVKAVDSKVGELQSKYDEIVAKFNAVNERMEEMTNRISSVEDDTAVKKSGELENILPETPVVQKSLWGGRFLNAADIF